MRNQFWGGGIGFILLVAVFYLWSQNSTLKSTISECNTKIISANQTIVDVGSQIGLAVQKSYLSYADAKQSLQDLSHLPFTQQDLCGQSK